MAGAWTAGAQASASLPCTGVDPASVRIVTLREPGHAEQLVRSWRNDDNHWLLPLQASGPDSPWSACAWAGQVLYRVPAAHSGLRVDEDADTVQVQDPSRAPAVIDARPEASVGPGSAGHATLLESMGLNWQLGGGLAGTQAQASASGELFAWQAGWYLASQWGAGPQGVQRFDTYALREDLASGTTLRVGDTQAAATAQGEAVRLGGLSWGTDRQLRPGLFVPVLPNLRGAGVVPSPVEVYIDDMARFQRELGGGPYDLRNVPAQLGFNSYSVRTVDALGQSVVVQREIFLPAGLLPPGVSEWRIDAGAIRKATLGTGQAYGPSLVSGSRRDGVLHGLTVSGQALARAGGHQLSAGVDARLHDLWTGHVAALAARDGDRSGSGVRVRLEGGGRQWRLLGEALAAARPLPSLVDHRGGLQGQVLVRASWNLLPGLNATATHAATRRETEGRAAVTTAGVGSTTLVPGVPLQVSVTRTSDLGGRHHAVQLAALLPLDLASTRPASVAGTVAASNGSTASRLSYARTDALTGGHGSLGWSRDPAGDAVDAGWNGRADAFVYSASARLGPRGADAQVVGRGTVIWARDSLFATRPLAGAFAVVDAGAAGVTVLQDNRPAARTNAAGLALVPDLRALEDNQLALDPTGWPIEWSAAALQQPVRAPRGAGVFVSFRINLAAAPEQATATLHDPLGAPYAPGTRVDAQVDGQLRSTVIDRQGRAWLGDLLPATQVTVRDRGRHCRYALPAPGAIGSEPLRPEGCEPA